MMGQYLLRQLNGTRTQWDVALEEAEQLHDTTPLQLTSCWMRSFSIQMPQRS
jgi:hypothetical protein